MRTAPPEGRCWRLGRDETRRTTGVRTGSRGAEWLCGRVDNSSQRRYAGCVDIAVGGTEVRWMAGVMFNRFRIRQLCADADNFDPVLGGASGARISTVICRLRLSTRATGFYLKPPFTRFVGCYRDIVSIFIEAAGRSCVDSMNRTCIYSRLLRALHLAAGDLRLRVLTHPE